MRPPKIEETKEQRDARQRAQSENIRSIQDSAQARTRFYARLMNPRVSIATGRSFRPMI